MGATLKANDCALKSFCAWRVKEAARGESHPSAYLNIPSLWDKAVENTVLAVASPKKKLEV